MSSGSKIFSLIWILTGGFLCLVVRAHGEVAFLAGAPADRGYHAQIQEYSQYTLTSHVPVT